MLQLRESLFLDKQRALEELRAEIEQERRSSSSRTDERMAQMLAENAEMISVSDPLSAGGGGCVGVGWWFGDGGGVGGGGGGDDGGCCYWWWCCFWWWWWG